MMNTSLNQLIRELRAIRRRTIIAEHRAGLTILIARLVSHRQ